MHKKFADRYKGPYKVLELLENNNIRLLPINNGPPTSTHINNCKFGVVRPARLEAHDTSNATPSPPSSTHHMLDPFRFSIPNSTLETFLEDEDDVLRPAQPDQPKAPASVRPAPAPPSPHAPSPPLPVLPTYTRMSLPTQPIYLVPLARLVSHALLLNLMTY